MKRSLLNKWLITLRSGEFKQTKSLLHADDGYCCLGVLSEVGPHKIGAANWDGRGWNIEGAYFKTMIPGEVCEVLIGQRTKDYEYLQYLAALNDRGDSFDLIADVIERDSVNNILQIEED